MQDAPRQSVIHLKLLAGAWKAYACVCIYARIYIHTYTHAYIYIYIYIYILLPAIFDTRNMMARAAAQENFEESRGRGRKGVLMIISQFRFQHVFFRGWNRGNETVIDTHMCVTHTRDAAFLLSIDSKPHHTHTHARTHTHTHRTHSGPPPSHFHSLHSAHHRCAAAAARRRRVAGTAALPDSLLLIALSSKFMQLRATCR